MASIVALWFGCFDGAGALGYPCASDDDCGPTLSCEDSGCCGGACLFGTTDGTSTTTGETESTTTTTASSSTTEDPTTTEGSESSSSTGEPAECGNGEPEAGEECDEGEQNDFWNPCAPDCRLTILHFTSQDGDSDDFCQPQRDCSPSWHRTGGQDGTWGSGNYAEVPTVSRLVTREFTVPPPEEHGDLVPQIEMRHQHDFNVCEPTMGMPLFYDGAHVMLQRTDTMETIEVSPQRLDADQGEARCGANPDLNTPWCEDGSLPPLVFGGDSEGPTTARRFVIPDTLTAIPLRLVFEVGFDVDNCEPAAGGHGGGNPDPWQLHRVIVALAPPG